MAYLCAFPGRRDAYQLPAAFAEVNLLGSLITDVYCPKFLKGAWLPFAKALKQRDNHLIASHLVRSNYGHFILASLARYAKVDAEFLNQQYATMAETCVERNEWDLCLYQSYAYEAFTSKYRHEPRRILFHYDPYGEYSLRHAGKDYLKSSLQGLPTFRMRDKLTERQNAWKYADIILCASTFTKHTLIDAGASSESIHVTPYGENPKPYNYHRLDTPFHALYVGSMSERKGLHLLLHAWESARLPKGSRLTIVSRGIPRRLKISLSKVEGVCFVENISDSERDAMYQSADVFVMPSVSEGFGQVYLEALASGCPVIGSNHSVLPDFSSIENGVYIVPPGVLDPLVSQLEWCAEHCPGNSSLRLALHKHFSQYTWGAFRNNIREVLGISTR